MKQQLNPRTGRMTLQSFLKQKSPLGPLRVLSENVGGFFQIPLPGFKPFVVASPEANRKVLVTQRDRYYGATKIRLQTCCDAACWSLTGTSMTLTEK